MRLCHASKYRMLYFITAGEGGGLEHPLWIRHWRGGRGGRSIEVAITTHDYQCDGDCLNFVLSILPVLAMSETSIKVKIQHNGDIHTGVCPRDCKERDNKVSY